MPCLYLGVWASWWMVAAGSVGACAHAPSRELRVRLVDASTGRPVEGAVRVYKPDPRHPLRVSDLLRGDSPLAGEPVLARGGEVRVPVPAGEAASLLVGARGYQPVRVDVDDLLRATTPVAIHLIQVGEDWPE
jgi:hypothetical protein